eukprot:6208838-Pleurochrysis_carterae.AAC.1
MHPSRNRTQISLANPTQHIHWRNQNHALTKPASGFDETGPSALDEPPPRPQRGADRRRRLQQGARARADRPKVLPAHGGARPRPRLRKSALGRAWCGLRLRSADGLRRACGSVPLRLFTLALACLCARARAGSLEERRSSFHQRDRDSW